MGMGMVQTSFHGVVRVPAQDALCGVSSWSLFQGVVPGGPGNVPVSHRVCRTPQKKPGY